MIITLEDTLNITLYFFSLFSNLKHQYQIKLDPIYTGKLFYGVLDLLGKNYFPKGSRIVIIHTGGLQSWAGFKERFEK